MKLFDRLLGRTAEEEKISPSNRLVGSYIYDIDDPRPLVSPKNKLVSAEFTEEVWEILTEQQSNPKHS